MPRMPEMFDWIKIYLHGFKGDEALLSAELAYYTDRAESFQHSPIPSYWDQEKVNGIVGHA